MLFTITAQQYYCFPFLCFLKFPRSNATGKKTKKPKDRILSRFGLIPEENTTYQSRHKAPATLLSFVIMKVNTFMEQSTEYMM